jgi:SAM-dependent methyltransferase
MPQFFGDILYPIVGRASLIFDALRGLRKTAGRNHASLAPSGLDGTGRVIDTARKMPVLWDEGGVLYVEHESLGHSLWRAQEFSLFREHRQLLKRAMLDFGCGDGSFGSIAFEQPDYGADIDDVALQVARQFGLYQSLLSLKDARIPLADASVQTVVSNSVLEHVQDVGAAVSEIHRILANDGLLVFTVPVRQYERDLVKYFGKAAAKRINEESTHRNLWEVETWCAFLAEHGFRVEVLRQYQGHEFTFWFRMSRLLGNQGLAMFMPGVRNLAWKLFRARIVHMVKSSVCDTVRGANIFVAARKAAA